MEGILAILLIFGGGTLGVLSYSPIGKAIAARIRGDQHPPEADPAVLEELDRVRHELAELAERVDFAERMIANRGEAPRPQIPEAR
ncbi:MAG: hypothetical protein ACYC2K_11310 [Gemmatimonadales bacterium]